MPRDSSRSPRAYATDQLPRIKAPGMLGPMPKDRKFQEFTVKEDSGVLHSRHRSLQETEQHTKLLKGASSSGRPPHSLFRCVRCQRGSLSFPAGHNPRRPLLGCAVQSRASSTDKGSQHHPCEAWDKGSRRECPTPETYCEPQIMKKSQGKDETKTLNSLPALWWHRKMP